MIDIDINKVTTKINSQWDISTGLVKAERNLMAAIHILESVVDNQGEEYWEFHEKRITEFLSQFEK